MSEDERPNPAQEDPNVSNPDSDAAASAPPRKLTIKIGTQRDAALAESTADEGEEPAAAEPTQPAELAAPPAEEPEIAQPAAVPPVADLPDDDVSAIDLAFPAPRIKRVSADLQAEIDEALGDVSIEALLADEAKPAPQAAPAIELDQRCLARVIKCDREFVFLSLGGPEQGVAARRLFAELPEPGTQIEVIPVRYGVDDNLYEVVVPGASIDVQDWSDLSEGVVVEARITGHNKGGLECEVNHIRGFIPAGQVSLYRVEDLESYVGQSLRCVVTEANPQRRNLVLSHRAVLEREKQEARERLLQELEVGQVREGVVRRLQDFGAFVDLGGIDGLIHVSQLSWDRIGHPRDVLEEGQKVRVRISKIDPASGKIGLSYRDLLEDPWQDAANRFPVGSVLEGTVAKIMEFGAFVKLVPGVEGLVHISEIAHHRVHRVGALLKEGQVVQVKVLSIDPESQRLSLSIKAAQAAPPQPEETEQETEPQSEPAARAVPGSTGPLQGGLSRKTGGEKFGLNW